MRTHLYPSRDSQKYATLEMRGMKLDVIRRLALGNTRTRSRRPEGTPICYDAPDANRVIFRA